MKAQKPKNKTDIIEIAIPLFAASGYNGVSMRQIADRVGIKAASLYYHFPDKQALYIGAIKHAFAKRETDLFNVLKMEIPAREKLHIFIEKIASNFKNDLSLRILVQREMLDGDKKRLQLLAENVFHDFFKSITVLTKDLSVDHDPHLLAVSIFGLVFYHYQIAPIRTFLEGSQPEHDDPKVVADHVLSLLMEGIARP